MSDRLLTFAEAAAEMGCSRATVKRRVAAGALAVFTDKRLRRIRESDLRRYIAERIDRRGAGATNACVSGRVLAPGARLWD
jgi:excisionase family DNA binding protein